MTSGREVFDVAIVGSGFAGSILARGLAACGRRVVLIERERHPRFALGESTTPLANLALERLSRRPGLERLWQLSNWSRWRASHPDVTCGLKRGFVFYAHEAHEHYPQVPDERRRLAVAASPGDDVADTQWMRSEVDSHLARWAESGGVRLLEETEVFEIAGDHHDADGSSERAVLRGEGAGEPFEVEASFVVDASGGGRLASTLGVESVADPADFSSRLVYAHVDRLTPFAESAEIVNCDEPFPEHWSAAHHLTDVGWMYQLRFDSGAVSVGWLVDEQRASSTGLLSSGDWDVVAPDRLFERLLSRYPSLERQFAGTRARFGFRTTRRLQRRLERAHGRVWAALPGTYAFYDPLFSTGIAWSLIGVERLLDLLTGDRPPDQQQLGRYGQLLEAEAHHQRRLLEAAYRHLSDFERFDLVCQLYFVAASCAETCQRMLDFEEWRHESVAPNWAWAGFLGARDPVIEEALEELLIGPDCDRKQLKLRLEKRNVAGLLDVDRQGLYPADPHTVLRAASCLGLDRAEAERRLPRLLGSD